MVAVLIETPAVEDVNNWLDAANEFWNVTSTLAPKATSLVTTTTVLGVPLVLLTCVIRFSAAWMLLCSVTALVLKLTVAVPVCGFALELVYDSANVSPLATAGLKNNASVLLGPRAKSGKPTATGGVATEKVIW